MLIRSHRGSDEAHDKAKRTPSFRFYSLYDKVSRPDVLWVAYHRCRENDGAPGCDAQSFAEIEAYGLNRWLDELADELRTKTYQPQAVRRVWLNLHEEAEGICGRSQRPNPAEYSV